MKADIEQLEARAELSALVAKLERERIQKAVEALINADQAGVVTAQTVLHMLKSDSL